MFRDNFENTENKIKKALADFYNRQVLKLKSMAFLHRMWF